MAIKYDKILGSVREDDSGSSVPTGGTTGQVLSKVSNTDYDVTWSSSSGSSLSPSYHKTEAASATITYTGVNSSSSSETHASWSLIKKVLSGNNRETITLSTATDQWANRATASYTASLTYSN